ncbi:MAG TPA: SAF domain-containing protein [Candidatus Dormibacteraeota bacterium]
MAIQPNKPQNRVFLLVGIVLAAAAALAVLFAISRSGSNTPTSNVVVAKTTISAGTSITADMLTTTGLAQGSFPADVYTDPGAVVGKTAPVTLSQNTPLYQSLFVSANPGVPGQAVVAHLDITKGYVALAIPAASTGSTGVSAELASVGFYIQPEDHIDILIDPGIPGQAGVRYSFQDVRVLRVGASGATTAGAVGSYIIELPRSQAEIMTALTTGRTGGQTVLKYVLRPANEWGKRDGANGFDKPNYEASTAAPLTTGADSGASAASLNALFAH